MTQTKEVPLSVYARDHKLTHYQAYNLMLTGQVQSVRKGSRWFVIVEETDDSD